MQLNPSWMLARRHGEEVLSVLRRIDEHIFAERERANAAARNARKVATAARNAALAAHTTPKPGRGRVARRQALAATSLNIPVNASLLAAANNLLIFPT